MNRRGKIVGGLVMAVVLCGLNVTGYAQSSKSKTDGDKTSKSSDGDAPAGGLKLRKVTGIGADSVVKTPEFRSSASHGVKEPQEWGEIEVTFDTAPDWIDTVTLRFYVMAQKSEGGKKQYSFYQLVVRYRDVEKGKSHKASVHLAPMALKRFGPIVAVGVEAMVDDSTTPADFDENKEKAAGFPVQWWTKTAVVEKESVKSRDGYLKARSETPFSLVDFDDYEVGE